MTEKEFIEKNCKECTEKCEKGMVETNEHIYCADIDVKEKK